MISSENNHIFISICSLGMALEPGWPCSGPLLRLAERFLQKLLPAFKSATGMPYGTINLKFAPSYYCINKETKGSKTDYLLSN